MYWAVARLEPHRERLAAHFLELAGYEVYIPRLRDLRDGRRRVTPLFPSYAFVAIENGWHNARWSIGVVALIMSGERPGVVHDAIIADLRRREIRGAIELPARELVCGAPVRIVRGPLRELEGLYAGQAAHERVAILLSALGRVVIKREDVEPIERTENQPWRPNKRN